MALALGFASIDADALTLGRLNVQSTLGEPLRAEIAVTDLSPAEADGLRISIAAPPAFRSAGIPYSTALADVRITLQKRPDGQMMVQLNGGRSLNDPFIDLLLEVNWSSGRIVRDYTVLLDPPVARQAAAPVAPTAPQTSAAPAQPPAAALQEAAAPVPAPIAPPATGSNVQLTVRPGDTAGNIANSRKPAGVSLDQMLVALLRANPEAFVDGNVNRMKSGAVLALPDDAQVRAAEPDEAARVVKAQSKDFGEYRRRLADNASGARTGASTRQASGKLQASVEERSAANTSTDKLKLSQGGAAGAAASAAENKLARTRQAQATNARAAELAKNLADLKKLQATGGVASAAAPSTRASATAALTVPIPVAGPAAGANARTPGASAAAAASLAAALAAKSPANTMVGPGAAPDADVAPMAEPGLLAGWLDNPLMLGAAGLLAALLAFLLYRVLKRRRPDSADSAFPESQLPREPFFGASGGQQVDTADSHSSMASSMSYSPSQLDASDADPIAEADVYLAYGHDLQAEGILREAMRLHPERAAIPLKLLEIHATRRDLRAFRALASDVHKMTKGTGPDWACVVELGRELDPGNSLYQAESAGAAPLQTPAAAPRTTAYAAPSVTPPPAPLMPSIVPLNFDLSLPKTFTPAPPARTQPPAPGMPVTPGSAPKTSRPPEFNHEADDLIDTEPGVPESIHGIAAVDDITHPATLRGNLSDASGFIDFDIASLSKRTSRTGNTGPASLHTLDDKGENPNAIKLALARELQAIGDIDGARSLVQEVAHDGTGDLQAKARQLLAQLQN